MIQRIQTIYLFLAAILTVVCFFLPLGTFTSESEQISTMYNLWLSEAQGDRSLITFPLFIILLLSSIFGAYSIFQYTNRKFQAMLCVFNIMLLVCWYIVFIIMVNVASTPESSFWIGMASSLPAFAIVLYFLAHRRIKSDEALVRAADRIR